MALEQIIYVADPMCSWCWGFAPEIKKLRETLAPNVEFSVIMGGLRDGHVWDSTFRAFLEESWQKVAALTGQPFSTALLQRSSFDYTTEPACRAVVAIRELDEEKAFEALLMLQKAFYEDGLDITNEAVIMEVLSPLAVKGLEESFRSETIKAATRQDRNRARLYGASSFPSLVILDDQGHLSVIRGYRSYKELTKALLI